jgi:hypothetical protein
MLRDENDTITIIVSDDDEAIFSLISETDAEEGGQNGAFRLISTKMFDRPIAIDLGFTGRAISGTDYTALANPFIFPALSFSIYLPIASIDDDRVEGFEEVIVSLDGIAHDHATVNAGASVDSVTIRDNDYAILTIEALSSSIDEGTSGAFRVSVDRPVDYDVQVSLQIEGSATEGIDFDSIDTSLLLPAYSLSLTFPVTAFIDEFDEDVEEIGVSLGRTSNHYVRIHRTEYMASMIINDVNPLPALTILPAEELENAGSFRFTVQLSVPSERVVTVDYDVADIGDAEPGIDLIESSGTLEFLPGETTKTVEVTIIDDQTDEYNESFQLLLSQPVNAAILINNGIGTIIDNDAAQLVSLTFSKNSIPENGGSAYFTAKFDSISGKNAVIRLAFSGSATLNEDYIFSNDSLIIVKGQTSDSILVTSVADDRDELNEQIIVTIIEITNANIEDNTPRTLEITDQDQTISFGAIAEKRYGDVNFVLNGSSTAGLEVAYVSSNIDVAKITGKSVTITGTGVTTITASQPGNELFEPAANVMQTLTVTKAPLTIRVNDVSVTYGDALPDITDSETLKLLLSISGFVNGDDATDIDANPVLSTTATVNSDAGTYPITISGGYDNNYTFALTHGTLTIEKAMQTITFDQLPIVLVGDAPVVLTATSTSGLPVYFESADVQLVQISEQQALPLSSGTATIVARQDGNINYLAAANVEKELVINDPSGFESMTINGPLCYPNPFSKFIYLNEVCKTATSIVLYDLSGKKVLMQEFPSAQIDGSALRDGVYLLKVNFKNGKTFSRQIVKQ